MNFGRKNRNLYCAFPSLRLRTFLLENEPSRSQAFFKSPPASPRFFAVASFFRNASKRCRTHPKLGSWKRGSCFRSNIQDATGKTMWSPPVNVLELLRVVIFVERDAPIFWRSVSNRAFRQRACPVKDRNLEFCLKLPSVSRKPARLIASAASRLASVKFVARTCGRKVCPAIAIVERAERMSRPQQLFQIPLPTQVTFASLGHFINHKLTSRVGHEGRSQIRRRHRIAPLNFSDPRPHGHRRCQFLDGGT